jgi:hypothetical protein
MSKIVLGVTGESNTPVWVEVFTRVHEQPNRVVLQPCHLKLMKLVLLQFSAFRVPDSDWGAGQTKRTGPTLPLWPTVRLPSVAHPCPFFPVPPGVPPSIIPFQFPLTLLSTISFHTHLIQKQTRSKRCFCPLAPFRSVSACGPTLHPSDEAGCHQAVPRC